MCPPALAVAVLCTLALATTQGCGGDDGALGDDRGAAAGARAGSGASGDFPLARTGKADVAGRRVIGVASPYPADPALREQGALLDSRIDLRREAAWRIVAKALAPVPLVEPRLTDEAGALPRIARWQSWYSKDDFARMFKKLYADLGVLGRRRRAPFSEAALGAIFDWNAKAMDRAASWPLERYLDYIRQLGKQQDFDGVGGDFRIAYSPAAVLHWLRSYGQVLLCSQRSVAIPGSDPPRTPDNFAPCLPREFPLGSALVKAQWVRADFGRGLPTFDTSPAALRRRLGPGAGAHWPREGDRQSQPGPDRVHTVRLRNGSTYRLGGLHIMTKELRHWVWITLWWSDKPDEDFGADRPASIRALGGAWSNYKMCVVTSYIEQDEDPVARFRQRLPALAEALAAVQAGKGSATWCSSGYMEHGRGNARTNCIGCHQHAGTNAASADIFGGGPAFPSNGRTQLRINFPADYTWAFNQGDNLSRFIADEVAYYDAFEP